VIAFIEQFKAGFGDRIVPNVIQDVNESWFRLAEHLREFYLKHRMPADDMSIEKIRGGICTVQERPFFSLCNWRKLIEITNQQELYTPECFVCASDLPENGVNNIQQVTAHHGHLIN